MAKSRSSGAPQKAGASGGIALPKFRDFSAPALDNFFTDLVDRSVNMYRADLPTYTKGLGLNATPAEYRDFTAMYQYLTPFINNAGKLNEGKLVNYLQTSVDNAYQHIVLSLNGHVGKITDTSGLKYNAKTGALSGTVVGSKGAARVTLTPRNNVISSGNGLQFFFTRIKDV